MPRLPIRLVTFDALYTLIVPRLPVHVQYSQTFAPYLGVLDPDKIRHSFRVGEKTAWQRYHGVYCLDQPISA
jgi:hypothetical protein